MSEFLAMGGYAFYVWTSYAIFAVIVVYNLLQPRFRRRTIVREVRQQIALEQLQKERNRSESDSDPSTD